MGFSQDELGGYFIGTKSLWLLEQQIASNDKEPIAWVHQKALSGHLHIQLESAFKDAEKHHIVPKHSSHNIDKFAGSERLRVMESDYQVSYWW